MKKIKTHQFNGQIEMKIIISVLVFFIISNSYSQNWWTDFYTGYNVVLNSTSEFVVCGENGIVLKSTNYGYNWINIGANGIPSNVNLNNVFASRYFDTIFVAGNNSMSTIVYRTVNGGSNWNTIFSQNNGSINSIYFYCTSVYGYMLSTGFMVGNPVNGRWSFWKTTNKGLSWDSTNLYISQNNNETGYKNCVSVWGSKIWFGTNNHRIYYSSNYGLNWTFQNVSEQNIYSICFNDSLSGAAGGANFLITTNGGNNWSITPSIGTGDIKGIVQFSVYTSYSIIRGNSIYNFYQSNWVLGHTTTGIYQCYNKSFGSFPAVTNNGIFTRGGVVGVKPISNEVPTSFSLSQNYPNPFNPSTKIKFDIPLSRGVPEGRGVSVQLIIYDLLGREVATLVNEQLKPGTYEVEFDGANFPSGVYFYILTTESFNQTKRMVLIK